jgi:hypothetical protein
MTGQTGKYGPIEVFRTGTFQPMGGEAQTITETNLREIAEAYDRELAPAPVVIGHPETDAPAFGWVEHLYVEGGILKATLQDTVSEFADVVKEGRYKRVSISLFLPRSTANPKPGRFYLKHVGFLGAAAPAVPGLKPVKFHGGTEDSLTFSQVKPGGASVAQEGELVRLRRQVREQELERLIGEGRVLPAFKEEVLSFAASLDDSETVSFSDRGEAVTRKDWFMSYLARQPQVVSFGELDLGTDPMDGPPVRQKHNVPDGYKVDRKNEGMFFAAQRIAREQGISFANAIDRVIEGQR